MNGFVSYSHEDYDFFCELRTHLRALERQFDMKIWSDQRINAGHVWTEAINEAIKKTDVALLLLSPKFIESDYIYDTEIPAICARRASGALVIPIVLRRCSWQMVAGVLQAVPTDKGRIKPIDEWTPPNSGFDCARDQIARSIESYFGIAGKTLFGSV